METPDVESIDEDVIEDLAGLGYDKADMRAAVKSQSTGPLTTVYRLQKRRRKELSDAQQDDSQHQLQSQAQRKGNQPLRVVVGPGAASAPPTPADHSGVIKVTPLVDSAVDPYTPRTAQAEIVLPDPASPISKPTNSVLTVRKYSYTGATAPTTGSLLTRIRPPATISTSTTASFTTPQQQSQPGRPKRSILLPLSTIDILKRHPHATLTRGSPTTYTCTVSPPPRSSPLEAKTPELAMEIILGTLMGDWSFRLVCEDATVRAEEGDEEVGAGFEQSVRDLVREAENASV
ncbi:hypothetical protein DFJ77DRAFT_466737 [Powellomyces hirtus]|nr:hypothetical protein DFJ77DRAFT_466737 [Powellomyces hirtus]